MASLMTWRSLLGLLIIVVFHQHHELSGRPMMAAALQVGKRQEDFLYLNDNTGEKLYCYMCTEKNFGDAAAYQPTCHDQNRNKSFTIEGLEYRPWCREGVGKAPACPAPPNPVHGSVECPRKNPFTYESCHVSCHQDYGSVVGIIVCQENLQWDFNADCKIEVCPIITHPKNGSLHCDLERPHHVGKSCNVTCDMNFQPHVESVHCREDGNWSDDVACTPSTAPLINPADSAVSGLPVILSLIILLAVVSSIGAVIFVCYRSNKRKRLKTTSSRSSTSSFASPPASSDSSHGDIELPIVTYSSHKSFPLTDSQNIEAELLLGQPGPPSDRKKDDKEKDEEAAAPMLASPDSCHHDNQSGSDELNDDDDDDTLSSEFRFDLEEEPEKKSVQTEHSPDSEQSERDVDADRSRELTDQTGALLSTHFHIEFECPGNASENTSSLEQGQQDQPPPYSDVEQNATGCTQYALSDRLESSYALPLYHRSEESRESCQSDRSYERQLTKPVGFKLEFFAEQSSQRCNSCIIDSDREMCVPIGMIIRITAVCRDVHERLSWFNVMPLRNPCSCVRRDNDSNSFSFRVCLTAEKETYVLAGQTAGNCQNSFAVLTIVREGYVSEQGRHDPEETFRKQPYESFHSTSSTSGAAAAASANFQLGASSIGNTDSKSKNLQSKGEGTNVKFGEGAPESTTADAFIAPVAVHVTCTEPLQSLFTLQNEDRMMYLKILFAKLEPISKTPEELTIRGPMQAYLGQYGKDWVDYICWAKQGDLHQSPARVLVELMIQEGLTIGHLVHYFSSEVHQRKDIVQMLHQVHSCEFCDKCYDYAE